MGFSVVRCLVATFWKDLGHPASDCSNLAGRLYLFKVLYYYCCIPPSLRTPFRSRGTLSRGALLRLGSRRASPSGGDRTWQCSASLGPAFAGPDRCWVCAHWRFKRRVLRPASRVGPAAGRPPLSLFGVSPFPSLPLRLLLL